MISAQQALKNLLVSMLTAALFMCLTSYLPFSFVAGTLMILQWPIWLRAAYVVGYLVIMLVVFGNMPNTEGEN